MEIEKPPDSVIPSVSEKSAFQLEASKAPGGEVCRGLFCTLLTRDGSSFSQTKSCLVHACSTLRLVGWGLRFVVLKSYQFKVISCQSELASFERFLFILKSSCRILKIG